MEKDQPLWRALGREKVKRELVPSGPLSPALNQHHFAPPQFLRAKFSFSSLSNSQCMENLISNGTFLLEGSGISIFTCYDQEFCQMDSTEGLPGWPLRAPSLSSLQSPAACPYSQDSCVGSESGHAFTWKSIRTCVCSSLFGPPRHPLGFANLCV